MYMPPPYSRNPVTRLSEPSICGEVEK